MGEFNNRFRTRPHLEDYDHESPEENAANAFAAKVFSRGAMPTRNPTMLFAGQFLDLAVFFRCFKSDVHIA